MIKEFYSIETKKIWEGKFSKKLPTDIQRSGIAVDKLALLHAADILEDLKVPPGNELEPLTHDRKGQYSIRINKQWRICFTWRNGHAYRVEIIDYH
ncbi:MAG: type II toxin-antitoxin system RelE/ParE family toxin [SAR324 cluster bacterium]|nr:type II toxin-antitoxin system RelE/ParE family toxin [SAR324 cluster bacterium]